MIDVSGDGANNSGRPVHVTRDELVAKGIVISPAEGTPAEVLDDPVVRESYLGNHQAAQARSGTRG